MFKIQTSKDLVTWEPYSESDVSFHAIRTARELAKADLHTRVLSEKGEVMLTFTWDRDFKLAMPVSKREKDERLGW